ncbi:MAG: ATP-binding protein [Chloroflexi bacterium]|nr:ATP-binding protein [Chloroflexota bacterium]
MSQCDNRPEKPPWSIDFDAALAQLEAQLGPLPETTARPSLLMFCGLPGTGKSYFARRLAERAGFAIVESDRVRKVLFSNPTYSTQESQGVHRLCHALLARLLAKGFRVIYDATNLIEFHREFVYLLAERAGAKLVIVRTWAPEEVVRQRLMGRPADDYSDADWNVYQALTQTEQPIRRPHLVVDTSQDPEAALSKILRAIKR